MNTLLLVFRCYMDGVQASRAMELSGRRIRKIKSKMESINLEKAELQNQKKSLESAYEQLLTFGDNQSKKFREGDSVCKDFYSEHF